MSWGHPELIPQGSSLDVRLGLSLEVYLRRSQDVRSRHPQDVEIGSLGDVLEGFFINISIFSLQILVIYACYLMWIKRVASGIFLCILFTFVLSMLDFVFFATSLILTLLHIFKSIGTVINLSTSKSAKISCWIDVVSTLWIKVGRTLIWRSKWDKFRCQASLIQRCAIYQRSLNLRTISNPIGLVIIFVNR